MLTIIARKRRFVESDASEKQDLCKVTLRRGSKLLLPCQAKDQAIEKFKVKTC